MSLALFKVLVTAVFVWGACARTFLNSDLDFQERMSSAAVRESLFAELKHAVTHGPGETKLLRLEAFLKPMYAALPKNEFGNLGVEGVGYALHRFFVERHGWHVKGLEPSARTEGVSPAASILKDRVPSYLANMVEEQLEGRGFGLHQLAVLAASLEHLVHDDAIGRLQTVFEAHDLPLTGGINEGLVDAAIDTYMMVYIQGGNLTGMTPKKLQAKQARLTKKDPSWRETRVWMRDIRRSVSYATRDRRNPFVDSGMDFGDAAHVVEEIGEQFGRWQDLECRSLKNILVDLDRDATGRVPLPDFYRATLDGMVPKPFEFDESIGFLRQLGALDESDALRPTILVPNYVNARTNCLTTTSFYAVCCIDECERLLGKLEREIGAPAATPARIAQLVENLPSDTVEAPRVLSGALLRRLTELAERHDGAVPLHSRLFAQWMHHAYPRECVFPHVSGVSAPASPDDWMPEGERHATEEEMRQAIDEAVAKTDSESTDPEAVEEPGTSEEVELMWTEDQELFAVRKESSVKSGVFRECCRFAALAVVLSAVAFHLARLWTESRSTLFPSREKDLCKCV